MRTTDGWLIPDEYIDVILEYLKSNGSLNPNITSIMGMVRHDPKLKTSESVYSVEYSSANTTELKNFNISINYIKSVIRDRKINKIISGNEISFDKSKGLDKDERYGCTAYGFSISHLRESAIKNILDE